MSLTPEMCAFIRQTARSFTMGAPRRRYMAQTLETFHLSQRDAQQRFGWHAIRCAKPFRKAAPALPA